MSVEWVLEHFFQGYSRSSWIANRCKVLINFVVVLWAPFDREDGLHAEIWHMHVPLQGQIVLQKPKGSCTKCLNYWSNFNRTWSPLWWVKLLSWKQGYVSPAIVFTVPCPLAGDAYYGCTSNNIWAAAWQNQQMTCAPSEVVAHFAETLDTVKLLKIWTPERITVISLQFD